jgi:hypothetical protein
MSLSERYVAFLDILGFSEIVRSLDKMDGFRADDVIAVLEKIGARDRGMDEAIAGDFRFQTFSDSIVMSCPASPGQLIYLMFAVESLVKSFLDNSMLSRGAVTKGMLHHSENVMLGSAFLEAYRIESGISKFPRVVLSKDVYHDLSKTQPNMVKKAADGPPFLDVLRGLRELRTHTDDETPHAVARANKWQENLQRLLDQSIHEPSHFEKLRWFATYWNTTVLAYGPIKTLDFQMEPGVWSHVYELLK